MMKQLRITAFYVLLACSTACGEDAIASRAIVLSDSAGVTIVSNDVLQLDRVCHVGVEPETTIGSASGGNEYELYRVFGASQLSDGRIVLVNQGSQELRFYDADGRHVLSTGRSGRGPGEFENAFHLWVLPGDTIWVGDYRPWQFLVFGPDGQWVRTVRPQPQYPNPPGVVDVLDDGRALLAARPITSEGPDWGLRHLTVVMHGPDGAALDTVGTYPDGRWGMLADHPRLGLYPLFESFARIDARGSTIAIAHSSEPELALHSAGDALVLTRIVRWTTGSRSITAEDIEMERQRLAEPYKDMDVAMRRQLLAPLISEERPVADRMPAFVSLRLGRDGRVWVRDFVRPTETPE